MNSSNIFGVRIKIKHSDSHQIYVYGVNDDFYVRTNYGDTHHRWTVTKSNVRIGRNVYSPPTNTNHPTTRDQTDGVTGDMAGIFDGEGDADGQNNDAVNVDADQNMEKDNNSNKQKKVRQKSPKHF